MTAMNVVCHMKGHHVLQLLLGNSHPALLGHSGFLMFTEEKQIGLSARNMEPNPGFPALTLPTHKAETLLLLSKTQFPYSYTGIRFVLTTTRAMSKTNHPRHGLVLTKINSPWRGILDGLWVIIGIKKNNHTIGSM